MAGTKIYKAWKHIKQRCFNRRCKSFKDYGGRGVTMFKGWINNFPAFARHIGNPPSPKHSVDRKENDGDYAPGNVRWATQRTQSRNSRRTKLTQAIADRIREDHRRGIRPRDIINSTSVSRSNVEYVLYQGGWT